MGERLRVKRVMGLLYVVVTPCICVHPFGPVLKCHDDFGAIVDCSSPTGFNVNEHTELCRVKFSSNLVQDVTTMLQRGDLCQQLTSPTLTWRAVNIHPAM